MIIEYTYGTGLLGEAKTSNKYSHRVFSLIFGYSRFDELSATLLEEVK